MCFKTKTPVKETFDSDSWVKTQKCVRRAVIEEAESAAFKGISIGENAEGLSTSPSILERMLERSDGISIGKKFKKLYLRSRLNFRIRHLSRVSNANKRDKWKRSVNKTFKNGIKPN